MQNTNLKKNSDPHGDRVQKNRDEALLLDFLTVCYAAGEPRTLVKAVQKYFGNPVALYDVGLHVIAWAGDKDIDDSYWQETVRDGRLSEQTVNAFVRDGLLSPQMIPITPPVNEGRIYEPLFSTEHMRRLGIGIPDKTGMPIAWFSVFEHSRAFSETDKLLLRWLVKVLIPMMELYNSKSRAGRENAVSHIMASILTSDENLADKEARLIMFGWKPGRYNRLLLLRASGDEFPQVLREYIDQQLQGRIKSMTNLIFNDQMIVIMSAEQSVLPPAYFKSLEKLLEKFELTGAFSGIFSDVSGIRPAYKQALRCMRVSRMHENPERLVSFDDYAADILINESRRYFPTEQFCHPYLYQLLEYDNAEGTNYFRTLRSFIFNMGNLSTAAADLNVHRNTLSYRMEKIQDLLGVEAFDNRLQKNLYLSYMIYDSNMLHAAGAGISGNAAASDRA